MTVDRSTIGGILLALVAIGAGVVLDGGNLSQILQPTAAIIVFGGTTGAVLIQFPWTVVAQAFTNLKFVFFTDLPESTFLVRNLLQISYKARKDGLLSLDPELDRIQDSFLRESLMLAIDGVSAPELRKMMELQMDYHGEQQEQVPRVFDAAGGFAPTLGILGAVIGLIQVMQRLKDINEVGHGIAVAFVATLYGVGAANLVFLPWAAKLRLRIREKQILQEMTLEAVLSILQGVNPHTLEQQLENFVPRHPSRRELEKVPA